MAGMCVFLCGVGTQKFYTSSLRLRIYRSKKAHAALTQKITWLQKNIILMNIGFLLALKSQVGIKALMDTET